MENIDKVKRMNMQTQAQRDKYYAWNMDQDYIIAERNAEDFVLWAMGRAKMQEVRIKGRRFITASNYADANPVKYQAWLTLRRLKG